jgi:hypothetical protein
VPVRAVEPVRAAPAVPGLAAPCCGLLAGARAAGLGAAAGFGAACGALWCFCCAPAVNARTATATMEIRNVRTWVLNPLLQSIIALLENRGDIENAERDRSQQ